MAIIAQAATDGNRQNKQYDGSGFVELDILTLSTDGSIIKTVKGESPERKRTK